MNKIIIASLLFFFTAEAANKITFSEKKEVKQRLDFQMENVLDLEERLNRNLIGQPEATAAVADVVINFAAKMNNSKKPIGALLFVGPTGVGKTELCKLLARELLGSESKLIRLNMGDFAERWSLTRLIGSAPGYVDHDKGGQLTEALKKQPNAIVLLDEMEKAAPEIQKAFLSVFDEGFIIDSHNERIDCTKCLFIMTSNLAGRDILHKSLNGMSSEEILDAIEPKLIHELSPELYNRIQPIVFHALQRESLLELIHLMLAGVQKEQQKYTLHFDQSVIHYLYDNGYSKELGARPLKGLIEKKIVGTLSKAIVREKIPQGSTLSLSYDFENAAWEVDY